MKTLLARLGLILVSVTSLSVQAAPGDLKCFVTYAYASADKKGDAYPTRRLENVPFPVYYRKDDVAKKDPNAIYYFLESYELPGANQATGESYYLSLSAHENSGTSDLHGMVVLNVYTKAKGGKMVASADTYAHDLGDDFALAALTPTDSFFVRCSR